MNPVAPTQTPILQAGSLGTVDIAPEKIKAAVDELFKTLRNTERDGSFWGCAVLFSRDLSQPSAVREFLSPLLAKIAKSGLTIGSIEIRLLRGKAQSDTPRWHQDGLCNGKSAFMSFSSRADWGTLVLNDSLINFPLKLIQKEYLDDETSKKAELVAQVSTSGTIYSAQNIYHRGMTEEDFKEKPIQPEDWRLFLRFER